MSAELAVAGIQTGSTVIAVVRRDTDEFVWSTVSNSFVTYVSADFDDGDYSINLVEQDSSGYFVGDFPVDITTAGIYNVTFYSQVGSEDWLFEAGSSIVWNGTSSDTGDDGVGIAWASVAEYKVYKGITSSSDDAKIQALLVYGSAIGNSYLQRTVKASPFVKIYRNESSLSLNLEQYPVSSVTSVTFDYYDAQSVISGSEFYVNEVGTLRFKSSSAYRRSLNCDAIKVIFTAGFTSVPQDLKMALFLIVDMLFYAGDDEQVLTKQTIKDVSVSYGNPLMADAADPIIGNAVRLLDPYKNDLGLI